MFRKFILSCILVWCCQFLYCQSHVSDSLISRFGRQLNEFPQEKIHVHTDKSHYISGERIWFRAHLVDAASHVPVNASRYVYLELINPLDTVVQRVKIKSEDDVYSGYIPLTEDLPEGNYSIRAYTHFMRNLPEEYFFNKSIRVSHPLAATIKADIAFAQEKTNRTAATITLYNVVTRKKINPQNLTIRVDDKVIDPHQYRPGRDSIIRFTLNNRGNNPPRMMYFEGNKYKKFIPVPDFRQEDYTVSFYPEGGYLLQGAPCVVAFKALKTGGLSEPITGKIVDSEGYKLTEIQSNHLGMGSFAMIAEPGKTYYAVCKNNTGIEKRFTLPQSQPNTFSLKTRWANQRLYVSVQNSPGMDKNGLHLLIHSRGMVKYCATWDASKEHIIFEKNLFPSGILQILLIDSQMNILSERLIFCNSHDKGITTFTTDQSAYRRRDHITARVKLTGADNQPLQGNFSVSITDDHDAATDTATSILTRLLLTSELKGHIESPAYYFTGSRQAITDLDVLMMTQGWRRYPLPDMVRGKYQYSEKPIEQVQVISGTVKKLISQNNVEKSLVSIFSHDGGIAGTVETDEKGRFAFILEDADSTVYTLQALSVKGKKNVELHVDKDSYPTVMPSPRQKTVSTLTGDTVDQMIEESALEAYVVKADQRWTIENGIRTINLEEVVIQAQRKDNIPQTSFYLRSLQGQIRKTFDQDFFKTHPVTSMNQLISHMPGVNMEVEKITNPDGTYEEYGRLVTTRSKYGFLQSLVPMAIVIDDVIMPDDFDARDINLYNVGQIDVINDMVPSLGLRGNAGAVFITTKTTEQGWKEPSFNIKTITPLGYQKPIEFYSPKYETMEQKNNYTPDLRTTIYWNPNVTVSSDGEAIFGFYAADNNPTTYSVIMEGVSDNGVIFSSKEKIHIVK